eukprot:scaffold17406_cov116-Isochrysis_galbana.AAC.3
MRAQIRVAHGTRQEKTKSMLDCVRDPSPALPGRHFRSARGSTAAHGLARRKPRGHLFDCAGKEIHLVLLHHPLRDLCPKLAHGCGVRALDAPTCGGALLPAHTAEDGDHVLFQIRSEAAPFLPILRQPEARGVGASGAWREDEAGPQADRVSAPTGHPCLPM